ncbi:hypothetical protein, partial [Thiosulfatihalobacter marinus]|uniref:hypothetical protein n=1 Tax=Thiosulfatihalobacter marinus TaxID=2792481 RepID=UPI0018D5C937
SEEELKNLLMRVKEVSERNELKLNIKKTKIMATGPITSWQIEGEEMDVMTRVYFLGLLDHCRWQLQQRNKKTPASWEESNGKPR